MCDCLTKEELDERVRNMSLKDLVTTTYGWPILVIGVIIVLLLLSLHVHFWLLRREVREERERREERALDRMYNQVNDIHAHHRHGPC